MTPKPKPPQNWPWTRGTPDILFSQDRTLFYNTDSELQKAALAFGGLGFRVP